MDQDGGRPPGEADMAPTLAILCNACTAQLSRAGALLVRANLHKV